MLSFNNITGWHDPLNALDYMGAGSEAMEAGRKKVLIADSSTFMCIMLATTLEKLDFEVVGTSKSGNEAIEKIKALKPDIMPDIILVDPALPDKDGIEVTRAITEESPSTVVIMLLTGSETDPDMTLI